MPIVDLTEQFQSYHQCSYLSNDGASKVSPFMRQANSTLFELNILESKMSELQNAVKTGSRFNVEKQNQMIQNVKENMKANEKNIKRFAIAVDLKGFERVNERLKKSMEAVLEMKFLQLSFHFKEIYLEFSSGGQRRQLNKGTQPENERVVSLDKSHFLEENQQALIQQTRINEYKEIERSIYEISNMYKESINVVRMHDLMIDGIHNNIQESDYHINEGKRNLSEVQAREQKNRSTIVKVFVTLYVLVFLYLVVLS